MSVSARIVAGNFPYGNPGSVGEPLGVWLAHGVITGDATGGTAELRFVPQNPTDTPTLQDQRREYVYFVDGMRATADGDPGNWSSRIVMHMARSNSTFTPPFEHIRHGTTITDGFTFGPSTYQASMGRPRITW